MSFDPDSAVPRFGRKARLWFGRHLHHHFSFLVPGERGWVLVTVQTVPDLVNWYVDRWGEYCSWVNAPTYRGPRFPLGDWQIDWERIDADLSRALRATEAPALVVDRLVSGTEGQRAVGPAEPSAADLLVKSKAAWLRQMVRGVRSRVRKQRKNP